jgi:hypothetical protein
MMPKREKKKSNRGSPREKDSVPNSPKLHHDAENADAMSKRREDETPLTTTFVKQVRIAKELPPIPDSESKSAKVKSSKPPPKREPKVIVPLGTKLDAKYSELVCGCLLVIMLKFLFSLL